MKKILCFIFLLFSLPAIAAVEGDIDNNGAVDIGFGGTNAKTAGAARTALGLGNVTNTSDINKPVSTATQAALDLKAPLAGTMTEWTSGRSYSVDDWATYNGKIFKCLSANTSGAGNAPGVGSEWEEFQGGSGEGGVSTNISVVAGSSSVAINSSSGTDGTLQAATTIAAGAMTAADKTKLDGIAPSATANSSDATLLNRANHTGTQVSSTISDFASTVNTVLATPLAKLSGIAAGAEVNVNADWNASSGDAQILNKPSVVATNTDNTFTGQQTFEDIIIPLLDTIEFNLQGSEPTCSAGEYKIYFYGTKARQCINGTASDIGSGGSMTYPASGNFGYTSNGTTWGTMGLDTDISSTSSNDDTVPSAKAVRTALDAISASGVPSVTATPADAATGAVWYNSTANEFCVAESAGISCVAMTYTADDNDPSNSTPWFTDETDIALNTAKVSNAITLAGLGARGAAISVTGSTGAGYSKNSAGCTSSAGRGYNNDTVAACVTSSASNSTATTATVTIGTDSDTYSVTTVAPTLSGPAEFDLTATYYAVAPSGYTYSSEQTTNYSTRKYTSLSAALAAIPNTYAANYVINIIGDWSSSDTTAISNYDNKTEGAYNAPLVRGIGTARSTGIATGNRYRLDQSSTVIFYRGISFDGIEFTFSPASARDMMQFLDYGSKGARVTNCLINKTTDISGTSRAFQHGIGNTSYFVNNIFAGFDSSDEVLYANQTASIIYNNTIIGGQWAVAFSGTATPRRFINNIYTSTGLTWGTYDTATNNVTSATFVGGGDYHLASGDTTAKNQGTDLSGDSNYPFSRDIDYATRSGSWDVGADEL